MKVGSLFAGIGGFDLGLERAGMEVVWQVEIDPFCNKVLAKHWPDVKRYLDVKEVHGVTAHAERDGRGVIKGIPSKNTNDMGEHLEPSAEAIDDGHYAESCPNCLETIDLICGGFPCQPFSVAGKRKGKEDVRALWPQMFRIISEIRPRWVIGENVAGFINMGLDESISDLEGIGYEVQTFVIPACAVNAPHRRDRVWIVANDKCVRLDGSEEIWHRNCEQSICQNESDNRDEVRRKSSGCNRVGIIEPTDGSGDAADTGQQGLQGRMRDESLRYTGLLDRSGGNEKRGWEENWPEVAARLCRVDDGVSNRVDRLKALGNAVVPAIVTIIGRAIMEVECAGS